MLHNFRFIQSWIGRPSHPPKSSGASGEDGGEFGLDFPTSSRLDSFGELKPSYGSIGEKPRAIGLAERTVKAHTGMQQVLAGVALFWILCMAGQRLYTATLGGGVPTDLPIAGAPSPAPGASLPPPTCAAYTYPQCEVALHGYLSQSARTRCEAFERVKAEGDLVKFPYSPSLQEMCTDAGCCGCAGQCSKCPPLLPECSSWRLDGTWKVAFGDGSNAKYTFDANGHCEVEFPVNVLPVKWKEYNQAYIQQGGDAEEAQWRTVSDAKKECELKTGCKGITYDASTRKGETYYVYLKSTASLTPGPGTSWTTMVEEHRPELHGSAAVAGPLTQVSSDAAGTFRFDLHRASPQLFPVGSMEHFSVADGALEVERRVAGTKLLTGTGVQSK